MKKIFKCACLLLTSVSVTVAAADTTITFDDLPTPTSGAAGYYGTFTNYNGYQWLNFAVYQGTNTIPSGYYQGTVSPKNVAFNNLGQVAYITNTTTFNLVSAYLTAAWNDNLQLTVEGYLASQKIYTSNYTLSATAPTLVNFNFYGVNKVSFSSTGGTQHPGYQQAGSQFAMDNLTIASGSSAPTNPPVIISQPLCHNVQTGAVVALTVNASGSSPLNYQWLFFTNNSNFTNKIAGAINSSLTLTNVQFTNDGNYFVRVTNLYGSATSTVARLVVYSPITVIQTNRTLTLAEKGTTNTIPTTIPTNAPCYYTNSHLKVFVNGRFTNGVALNTNRMTIVMTHGWNSSYTNWPTVMAPLILNHVVGNVPNIVAWDWNQEAGTGINLPLAASRTQGQGLSLGQALQQSLGNNYTNQIHFIGHSLGTLVNGMAANTLHGHGFNPQNTHVTLFDEAELAPESWNPGFLAVQLPSVLLRIWYNTPIPNQAAWIDNYISAVGLPHPEAANVIMTLKAFTDLVAFHGYPCGWYDNSITNTLGASALMGYRWSFEQNTLTLAPTNGSMFVQSFKTSELDLQKTSYIDGVALLIENRSRYGSSGIIASTVWNNVIVPAFGFVAGGIQANGGIVINLFTTINGFLPFAAPMGVQPKAGSSSTNSPAYAWIPLTIPSNSISMSFDFILQGDGNQDSFTAALNGTNIFSVETVLIQTNVPLNTGLLPVSQYAGKTVELFVGIVGGTSTNANITVNNLVFYKALPPALQSQLTTTNLLISWPSYATNYVLQSSTNLFYTNSWKDVTNTTSSTNLLNTITNPVTGPMKFYRLKQ